MMDIESKITVYEVNGEKTATVGGPKLSVSSHWNDDGWVTLAMPDGQRVAVNARDLGKAVANATGWRWP